MICSIINVLFTEPCSLLRGIYLAEDLGYMVVASHLAPIKEVGLEEAKIDDIIRTAYQAGVG